MKKNFLYLIMAFAFAMPFVSCDKDDDVLDNTEQKHDPESDEDQTAIVAYDGLEWLQSSIVIVGDSNEVIRRVYGKPLDASNPGVISVPVSDLADAEEIFLSWVAPGKEAVEVEGGYDYALTDAYGNAQGSVAFRAVEGEAGVIASMTADAAGLELITEVQFVDADAWPENEAVEKYEAGKTYWLSGEEYTWKDSATGKDVLPVLVYRIHKQNLQFYCIQGNDKGKEAILVWLSEDWTTEDWADKFATPKRYIYTKTHKRFPSVIEAQRVLDFYNANHDAWQTMLEVMEGKGYKWRARSWQLCATGNSEFLLNSYDSDAKKIKCLDLDDHPGKICDVSTSTWFRYRYMHIRIFPPYFKYN